MAVGFGLSIDDSFLKNLKEADEWLDKIHNKSNKLKASTVSAFKEMSEKGVMHYVDSLKKQKQVLEEIGKIKNTGHNRLLTNLQRDAQLTVDEINKVVQALERTKNYKGEATGRTAISFANSILGKRGDKSIDNLKIALRQLEEAQNRQNLNTKRGQDNFNKLRDAISRVKKELDNATGASNRFKSSNEQFLAATRSLRAQLSLLYSVSKISGYIDKMIRVRKEFELQHKSMQILLRDKDEADKLWEQTINLAVKSPFRIKELVTYTKQLAAYRIETSKLHETTKMLSDVSAGLGVDMQRLILAFGQVRAANYLRGTELRQFTEAGIPMLDELAKMFSEMEGRAVRAGDVFERISKRMVTFKDVEEVFKRMTNESGVFYNMQEEQSKTLAGLISNFHDSIDLMLNDIGRSNDGVIKNMVSLAKDLVENWRAVAVVIKQVAAGMAIMQITKVIAGWKMVATHGAAAAMAMNGIAGASASARVGIQALNATFKSNPIFLWVGILASATHALVEYARAVNEANQKYDEMSRREIRRMDNLDELKKKSETYNEVIKDNSQSEEKRNQAIEENIKILNELKAKYPDIFSAIIQQKDGTLQLAEAIELQNQKLITNIALQQQAKGGWFQDTLSENYEDSIEYFGRVDSKIASFKVGLIDISAQLTQVKKQGLISDEEYNKFKDLLSNIRKSKGFEDLTKSFSKFRKEYQSTNLSKHIPQLGSLYDEWIKVYRVQVDYLNSLNDLKGNFENQKDSIKNELTSILESHEGNEAAGKEAAGAWIEGFLNNFGIVDKNIREWAKIEIPKMVNIEVTYPKIKEAEEPLLAWQESYNRLFKGFAGFVKIAQSTTKQDDVIERLNAQIKETEELIKRINNAGGIKATLSGGAYEGQDLAALNTELRELKEQQKWFGEESKKNNKQSTENINKQISLIKEMHKQYKELNKEFDKTASKEKVMTSYAEAFKEIFDEAGLSMSGRIIDDKAIDNLKESGKVSEDVVKKIEELSSKGTHIRSFSEDFVSSIKYAEGFIDKARDIGDGKWTYGYGETKGVKKGDTITKEAAEIQLRTRLTNDFTNSLNKVLDANRDIIVTQEQYNSLLDLTYQGGENAVRKLIDYAKNEEKAILHIQNIYEKVKNSFGEKEAERFGEAFVNKLKEAENIYDRIALLLQTMNLTVKGGKISSSLYKGMQQRSDERSALFATGKEVSKIIQDASIEVSQINIDSAKGVVETLKKLIPYAKGIGEKALEPLLKAIAEFESEIELEPKIAERESIESQIEDMFGNYEISLELEKMNIPPDLAKKLFNLDSIDLSDLRDNALDILGFDKGMTDIEIFDSSKFKEMAKEQREIVKDTLDKIGELEDEEQKKRLKKYVKYMLQAQSERVKIKIDEMNQLSEIEKLNVSELDKNIMRQGVHEETQKKLDNAAWEDFKNSDMYVRIFEDLDRASSKVLSAMQDKLIELRGSLSELSPENLKEIVRLEEKIAEAKIDKNPFAGLITSIKNLSSARKELNKLEEEHGFTYEEGVKKYEEQKRKIDELQISIKRLTDEYGADTPNAVFEKEDLETLKKANKEFAEILEKMGLLYSKTTSSKLGIRDSFAGMSEIFSQAAQSTNEIADAFDKIGGLSAAQRDNFDTIASIFGSMSGIMSGAEKMASGNPFAMVAGGIQALGSVASIVGEIFAIGDKKKERQIQREIKFVEDLERAYQKLEKQIDKAYEFDTLKGSYDAAQKNIDAQIESYNKMIAAEDDKKKTDKDRIKEWELAIEDLKEKQRELLETQVEELGSSYDFSSITEEFVNSWLDAFKDTGNGLKGLEENFEDFWTNIALKQAVMGGASKIMQPFLDAVNKALENDFKLDESELSNIDQLSQKAKEEMNLFLQQWYDRWGDFMTQGEQSELSGLQRGIQELTESTGQEIAAYLNSIRFFVAEQTTYLSQIAASFGNTEIENPMVGQLRIIASQTTAINELLNSLTSGGHSMGGRGFRVFIS